MTISNGTIRLGWVEWAIVVPLIIGAMGWAATVYVTVTGNASKLMRLEADVATIDTRGSRRFVDEVAAINSRFVDDVSKLNVSIVRLTTETAELHRRLDRAGQ
jgi:hypothetical protein